MDAGPLTRLDIALDGVSSLAVDTAPLIYLIERHPRYAGLVRETLRRVQQGRIQAFSSVVTLTEVLTRPLDLGDEALAAEYRRRLTRSRNFTLVTVDEAIATSAAALRARFRLRTPDALQVASALAMGCDALLTNDAQLARVSDLRVLILDDLVEEPSSEAPD
jgi:predicted nucleic acid-binding protein